MRYCARRLSGSIRLLPRGEVAALVDLIEVDDVRVRGPIGRCLDVGEPNGITRHRRGRRDRPVAIGRVLALVLRQESGNFFSGLEAAAAGPCSIVPDTS